MDYHAAACHVWSLPYGRNTDRSDYRLVLVEDRGTCSTKHALLAALAGEHSRPVHLALGIHEMSGVDTPGIGEVLTRYGLASVPEAHCYLLFEGRRVDLTRRGGTVEPTLTFLHEELMEPEQIGPYKVDKHREFVRRWAEENSLEFKVAWQAREECIAALAQNQ